MADIDKIILPNGTECNFGGGDPSNIFKNSNLFANYSDSDLEKIKYILPYDWDETYNYEEYDICNKDGVIRQANTTPTSGTFVEAEWNKVNLEQYMDFLNIVYNILGNNPSSHVYEQNKRYYTGDYVLYNSRIYLCNATCIWYDELPGYFINFTSNITIIKQFLEPRYAGLNGLNVFDPSVDWNIDDVVSVDKTPIKFLDHYIADDPSSFNAIIITNVSEVVEEWIKWKLPKIKVLTFTGDPNNWGPFTKINDNEVKLKDLNDTIDSNKIVSIFIAINCKFNNKNVNAFISEDEYVQTKVFDAIENLFIKDTIYLDRKFGVYSGAICDGTHYEFAIRGEVSSSINNGQIDIQTILSDFSTPGTFSPVISFIQLKVYYYE